MPDLRVRQQLTRGARIRAILEQQEHAPLRLADEIAPVLAVQFGLLDAIPLPSIDAVRKGLREALDMDAADAVRQIQDKDVLDDTNKQALRVVLTHDLEAWVPAPAPPA